MSSRFDCCPGFHTEGELEFPPPEILKLSMVIIVVPSILATCYWTQACIIEMLFGKF